MVAILGHTADEAVQIALTIDFHDQPITSQRQRRVLAEAPRDLLSTRTTTDALNKARTIRKQCRRNGIYTHRKPIHHRYRGNRR